MSTDTDFFLNKPRNTLNLDFTDRESLSHTDESVCRGFARGSSHGDRIFHPQLGFHDDAENVRSVGLFSLSLLKTEK